MDYRKPFVPRADWPLGRAMTYPQAAAEAEVLARPDIAKILEVGCANGWNMSRFVREGRLPVGIDVVPDRVRLARRFGVVLVASGLDLPFPDATFDMVYIQHALHHMHDVSRALEEVRRCLRPGGVLFLIETIEDNPLIRWSRRLWPSWLGDEVRGFFTFGALQDLVRNAGFSVTRARPYSVVFWMWEIVVDRLPSLLVLTPIFGVVERMASRRLGRYSAHCFLMAEAEPTRTESPE